MDQLRFAVHALEAFKCRLRRDSGDNLAIEIRWWNRPLTGKGQQDLLSEQPIPRVTRGIEREFQILPWRQRCRVPDDFTGEELLVTLLAVQKGEIILSLGVYWASPRTSPLYLATS